jgi:hypothetical protein
VGALPHVDRHVGGNADRGREDPANDLHLALGVLQVKLHLGGRGSRLQLVRDRGDSRAVALRGGLEVVARLLEARLTRDDLRLRVQVLVVRLRDEQDDVLDRGVVRPVGGV